MFACYLNSSKDRNWTFMFLPWKLRMEETNWEAAWWAGWSLWWGFWRMPPRTGGGRGRSRWSWAAAAPATERMSWSRHISINKRGKKYCISVLNPDPYVFGPPGFASGSDIYLYGSRLQSLLSISKKLDEKPWFLLFYDLFMTFYLWRMMQMYLQKGISIKLSEKKIIYCWHLESHWRKEKDSQSKVRIRGSGSASGFVPSCHGSGTLHDYLSLTSIIDLQKNKHLPDSKTNSDQNRSRYGTCYRTQFLKQKLERGVPPTYHVNKILQQEETVIWQKLEYYLFYGNPTGKVQQVSKNYWNGMNGAR
jgi:hypothetical protein